MKRAEVAHLSRVAELGCALCRCIGLGETPAEIHHLREGKGGAQRGSNWTAIPLCPAHHRGPHGIHGDRQAFKDAAVTEIDLLAMTLEDLFA